MAAPCLRKANVVRAKECSRFALIKFQEFANPSCSTPSRCSSMSIVQVMTVWVVAHASRQIIAGRVWQAMAAVVRRTAAYDGLLG